MPSHPNDSNPRFPRQPQQRPTRRPRPSGKPQELPPELKDATRGIRLQKVLSASGVAARRDCEAFIFQGRVRVNGITITSLPVWVDPAQDHIEVDGKLLPKSYAQSPRPRRVPRHSTSPDMTPKPVLLDHEKVYVLLNKPRGVISTTSDPDHRKTVSEMVQLPANLRQRLFPVGRLDSDSSGLILLTNDGELTNRLTHPRYGVAKQYAVSIRGRLSQDDIISLREGIHLAHLSHDADTNPTIKRASMAQVELLGYGVDRNRNERTRLLVTLREGQNREIRRMIASLGHKVRRLERVAIGPIVIKGLGVGQWRFLTPKEIAMLRKAAGQYESANASADHTKRPYSPAKPAGGLPPRAPRPSRPSPTRPASSRPAKPLDNRSTRASDRPNDSSRPRGGQKPYGDRRNRPSK